MKNIQIALLKEKLEKLTGKTVSLQEAIKQYSFDTYVDLVGEELETPVEVSYYYSPGSPGSHLDPPESSEVEITSIRNRTNGAEISDEEIEPYSLKHLQDEANKAADHMVGDRMDRQYGESLEEDSNDEAQLDADLEKILDIADASEMPVENASRVFAKDITDGVYLKNLSKYAYSKNQVRIATALHKLCVSRGLFKEDAKDVMRVNDIQAKSNGKSWKAAELATQMARAITTPDKAYNRYVAAVQVFGKDSRVANIFLDRAKSLGHTQGVTVAKDRDDAQRAKWEQERKEALAKAKVKADVFMKMFKKQYPDNPLTVTTSSPVQYQSGDGKTLYVCIGGDLSRLQKGMSGLGDRRPISRMHGAIHRMADKSGGHYDFNYSKPYISFKG